MSNRNPVLKFTQLRDIPGVLSVIVPVLNEEEVLPEFYRRLSLILDGIDIDAEIIFVNDGSTDQTDQILRGLQQSDGRIGIVQLSRRFGKEVAISAGMDQAAGDAVIFIDADLQDPPECIPEMIRTWQQGFDVVAMQRADRSVDSWAKRTSARIYYRLLSKLSDVDIPAGVGDFRLLSRRAVDALKAMPERNRYMKGLFAWIGFSYVELPYKREARHAGTTKWPFLKLLGLALDGVTAFSISPLRLASIAGLLTSAAAFVYGLFVLVRTVFYGDAVAGFPTLMVTLTFLGGMQLLSIGLLGEYVGRMFVETKQRPLYLVDDISAPNLAGAAHGIVRRTEQRKAT